MLPVLLKLLDSLIPITDLGVSGQALQLKQTLELLARDPNNAQQLNMMMWTACSDARTFQHFAAFVVHCLMQGNPQMLPHALQQFERICRENVQQAA